MRNLCQQVTDQIVALLEAGALPWVKPWSATPGANILCNAVKPRRVSAALLQHNPQPTTTASETHLDLNLQRGS